MFQFCNLFCFLFPPFNNMPWASPIGSASTRAHVAEHTIIAHTPVSQARTENASCISSFKLHDSLVT